MAQSPRTHREYVPGNIYDENFCKVKLLGIGVLTKNMKRRPTPDWNTEETLNHRGQFMAPQGKCYDSTYSRYAKKK